MYKKIFRHLVCWTIPLLAIAMPSHAQFFGGPATRIVVYGTVPANCAIGDIAYQTSATASTYICTAANTWTAVGSTTGFLLADGTVTGATSQAQAFTNGITGPVNKVTLTAPASSATITITNLKTLAVTNTLTLSGTDSTVMTFPTTSATVARTDAAQTFTGVQSFSGQVLGPVGNTPSTPAFAGVGGTNAGLWFRAVGTSDISSAGVGLVDFTNSLGLLLTTNAPTLAWTGSSTVGSGGRTAISEVASGIIGVGSGAAAATDGWLIDSGNTRVNADVTNATTTFGAITGLTATLKAGRKYTGQLDIKCNDSTAVEGIKFDFNGGTATMTSFWAAASNPVGSTVAGTVIATALSGAMNYTTLTGENIIHITFSLVVNGAGTFIPRFAQDSHAAGTATAELGSYMWIKDTP